MSIAIFSFYSYTHIKTWKEKNHGTIGLFTPIPG